jgi:nesprin-1
LTILLPTDVDVDKPDEKSIMTYVAKFLEKYPDPDMAEGHSEDPKVSDNRG